MLTAAVNGPNTGKFVIADAESLARFRRASARFLDRGAYLSIELNLPVARRERFERRINARYRECGCMAAAVAVLFTIAALICWRVAHTAQLAYGWPEFARDFAIILFTGTLAKVLTLAWAHLALKHTLNELARALSAREDPGKVP
jgi:hypothetical protein